MARRLYDYCHLRELRSPEQALREADRAVEEQASPEWGPLHRAE